MGTPLMDNQNWGFMLVIRFDFLLLSWETHKSVYLVPDAFIATSFQGT